MLFQSAAGRRSLKGRAGRQTQRGGGDGVWRAVPSRTLNAPPRVRRRLHRGGCADPRVEVGCRELPGSQISTEAARAATLSKVSEAEFVTADPARRRQTHRLPFAESLIHHLTNGWTRNVPFVT